MPGFTQQDRIILLHRQGNVPCLQLTCDHYFFAVLHSLLLSKNSFCTIMIICKSLHMPLSFGEMVKPYWILSYNIGLCVSRSSKQKVTSIVLILADLHSEKYCFSRRHLAVTEDWHRQRCYNLIEQGHLWFLKNISPGLFHVMWQTEDLQGSRWLSKAASLSKVRELRHLCH